VHDIIIVNVIVIITIVDSVTVILFIVDASIISS
jgi:hypothetical protein